MAQIRFEIAHQHLFQKMLDGAEEDIRRGVEAGAELLAAYTQSYGRRLWRGPYATGTTADSVAVTLDKPTRAIVSFSGVNRRGTRNAEVAFLNEYGKRGQPARPANRMALEDNEDAILQKMEEEIFQAI